MAATSGRRLLISRNGVLLGTARAKSITINHEPVDVTAGVERRLMSAQTKGSAIAMEIEGVMRTTALLADAVGQESSATVEVEWAGISFSGTYNMSRFVVAGTHRGAVSFTASLESSGEFGGGGGGAPDTATYVTVDDETATLTSSRRLIDGTGTTVATATGTIAVGLSSATQATLAGAAQSSDLAAVATSGDYGDLTGTPGAGAPATPSYLTSADETGTLANSRQLVAGTDIDLDDTTPGQLIINSTASGGGGGSANVTPDTHPSGPNAADDEFETGSSIDTAGTRTSGATAWVWRNQGGASANLSAGALSLKVPATGTGNLRVVEQVAPSAPWRYRMKCRPSSGDANFMEAGFALVNNSNGKLLTFGFAYNSGVKLHLFRWTNVTTFGALVVLAAYQAETSLSRVPWEYLEVELNGAGTTLTFRTSVDGLLFTQQGTETVSTHIGSVDRIGIFSDTSNSTDTYLSADWFRRMA